MPSNLPRQMAVLERKSSPGAHSMSPALWYHDTVAIAGLNAIARAHASFQPRATPYIGNAQTLLGPREAYVVHGLVYYIDGLGTVWTMGVDGKQTTIARFPIGLSQQEVSFAVSPDGCSLVAAVLTIPAKGPPASGAPFPSLNGTWKLETMSATVGGATQVLHTWTSASYPGETNGFHNLVLVGWDSTGPLVAVDTPLGTQNVDLIDNFDFFSGTIAHLDDQGMPGATIPTPSGCLVVQTTATGDITCVTQTGGGSTITIEVVDSTGKVEVPAFSTDGYPDAAAGTGGLLAITGHWRKGSAAGTLPANFQPEGWIDANTIFGRIGTLGQPAGNAALAHIVGGGATVENLGFQGDYVGMLSA